MPNYKIKKKQKNKTSGLKVMKSIFNQIYKACNMLWLFSISLSIGGHEAYRVFNERRLEQKTKVKPWGYLN